MKQNPCGFQQFAQFFPKVELPITLHAEAHHAFSQHNQPLPQPCIEKWLINENEEPSPFVEYLPCFEIQNLEDCRGLVYWKADLLQYEYHLCTFDKESKLVQTKIIAGSKTNGDSIIQRIATIEEDGIILVAEGQSSVQHPNQEMQNRSDFHFEIMAGGDILQAFDRSI